MYFLWKSIYLLARARGFLNIFSGTLLAFAVLRFTLLRQSDTILPFDRRTLIWQRERIDGKRRAQNPMFTEARHGRRRMRKTKSSAARKNRWKGEDAVLLRTLRTMPVPRLTVVLFRSWLEYFMRLFLLSIKWQLKLLNYTFIEIYEFLNQNLWLGARQDHWLVSHAHQASNAREKRRNVERERLERKSPRWTTQAVLHSIPKTVWFFNFKTSFAISNPWCFVTLIVCLKLIIAKLLCIESYVPEHDRLWRLDFFFIFNKSTFISRR